MSILLPFSPRGLGVTPGYTEYRERASDAREGLKLSTPIVPAPPTPNHKFLNGEVHHWYRLVLGYPDHLVATLLDRLDVTSTSKVLDPFCGSGTTLVECMKRRIRAVGVDANPSSVVASLAKTDWSLDPHRLQAHGSAIAQAAEHACQRGLNVTGDPTFRYLDASGMLKRGWINRTPLLHALAIKQQLNTFPATTRYKRLLQLCLLSEVVYGASNVKFGPEIYCGPKKAAHDVFRGFRKRVTQVAADLAKVRHTHPPKATVLRGDSRRCDKLLRRSSRFTACISSPPYPTEHDYTRNARLELAFLEHVYDITSLRQLKKTMIRSHSKGIYVGDRDCLYVNQYPQVRSVVARLRKRVGSASGFVGLYPDVVAHYFGGMKRHFLSLKKVLAPAARCAYVVGDQSSYRGVHIPTAEILAVILESVGFINIHVLHWRGRWSSTRSQEVDENILYFSLPSNT